MRTKNEIKERIQDLNDLRLLYVQKQNNYKGTEEEWFEGSKTLGYYQDREVEYLRMIELLEWVLK